MKQVFLDTAGLLAIWETTDKWHAAASIAYERMEAERAIYVTTSYVLLECGNALTRKPYREDVDELRRELGRVGKLVHPTPDDWEAAWLMYRRRESGAAGIVDCVSFVVMRRLGLTDAFTNDGHFRAAGFVTLY